MDKVDLCVFGIVLSIVLMGIMSMVFFIYNSDCPHYFGNICPANKWYFFPLTYLFPVYTGLYSYINFGMVLIPIFLIAVIYVPLVANEFRVGLPSYAYKTDAALRSPNNISNVYKAVELLQNMINQMGGV